MEVAADLFPLEEGGGVPELFHVPGLGGGGEHPGSHLMRC